MSAWRLEAYICCNYFEFQRKPDSLYQIVKHQGILSLFFLNFLFLHFYLKEAIATSEELGQDLEHVQLLQKKFEEFQTDLAAHEERVNEVNQLAAKLIQESHPEAELIVRKQDEVNAAWQRLKGLAQQRQGKLFGAAEVQRFNR